MNLETQLEILTDKLTLPTSAELEPWLRKLLTNPDSVIVIGIEQPLNAAGPHVGTAWLSAKERLKVREALQRLNDSRAKKGQSLTNEIPN